MPVLPDFDTVKAYFQTVRDIWSKSTSCQSLKSVIHSAPIKCTQIVGFGLGEVARELSSGWGRRSAFQHALALSLRDALSPHHPDKGSIVSYTQDPAYSDVDKELLGDHDIRPVNDPEGFLLVEDSTAVISCSPDVPVRSIVSELARPALMIWDKIRDNTTKHLRYVDLVETPLTC